VTDKECGEFRSESKSKVKEKDKVKKEKEEERKKLNCSLLIFSVHLVPPICPSSPSISPFHPSVHPYCPSAHPICPDVLPSFPPSFPLQFLHLVFQTGPFPPQKKIWLSEGNQVGVRGGLGLVHTPWDGWVDCGRGGSGMEWGVDVEWGAGVVAASALEWRRACQRHHRVRHLWFTRGSHSHLWTWMCSTVRAEGCGGSWCRCELGGIPIA
jgi:hypothetical protein